MNFRKDLGQTPKLWYEFFAKQYGQDQMYLMNYGFNYPDELSPPEMLDETEEKYRLQNQLYHHVIGEVSLENRNVLEVGCGGGAGSLYIARHFKPRSLTGVDLAKHAIQCCRPGHSYPNLQYLVADALNLPFCNSSFDVVINVESSHCYRSMSEFLSNISRVLIPGGYFLFADFRQIHQLVPLDRDIKASGLNIIKKNFISQNVLESMAFQENAKQEFLLTIELPELQHALCEFLGAKGSSIYDGLTSRTIAYVSYVLQKLSA